MTTELILQIFAGGTIGGGAGIGIAYGVWKRMSRWIDSRIDNKNKVVAAQIEGDRAERKQFQSMLDIYGDTSRAIMALTDENRRANDLHQQDTQTRSQESQALNTTLLHLSDAIGRVDTGLATNTNAVGDLHKDISTMSAKLETVSDRLAELVAQVTESVASAHTGNTQHAEIITGLNNVAGNLITMSDGVNVLRESVDQHFPPKPDPKPPNFDTLTTPKIVPDGEDPDDDNELKKPAA